MFHYHSSSGIESITFLENITLMTSLRLFQLRSRTLEFSPINIVGNISDPFVEILQTVYIYPTVSQLVILLINEIIKTANN